MRLLWIAAVLICVAWISGSRTIAVAAPAASPASCPSVLLIESTNGKYYIAVFQAHAPAKTAIDMTLYTKSAAYSLTLPEVTVDKPIATRNYTYRSRPSVIQNPGSDELLGATVQPRLGSVSTCHGENVIIPSGASLTDPDRHIDPATDALEAQLATEAASVTNIATPVPATGVAVPACNDPFDDASVNVLVKPTLTDDERRDSELFPVAVRVQLDTAGAPLGTEIESSSGNAAVDLAVVDAARKTTYHPARFACQPKPSSHVIRIDFSK
jgi:TonB family protein